jgi:carboxyl-terminal processing protease
LLKLGGAILAALLLGCATGVFIDQAYPGYVPLLAPHSSSGSVDSRTLQEAVRVLQVHYFGGNLDYQKLSQGSLRGLIDSLNDPFSEYLTPDDYKKQQDRYAGRYSGVIGVYVNFQNDYPVVSGIIPGSPAQKSGLQAQDVIVKIDGADARGIKAEQASARIRGPEGSTVTLTIRRGDSTRDVKVRRARFTSPSVLAAKLENSVLYLRIFSFGDTTVSEFDKQLQDGLPGERGVVLDLRDNPGGFIDDAAAVISRFVASGEAFELRDRSGTVDRRQVSGDHGAARIPLVVLVNANTASSSEIVSGSLQVHHRASLVGLKTYGKGSVQQDYQLPDGGDLHITIRRWYLPDGSSVEKKGLKPDVEVPLAAPDDMFDVVEPGRGHAADTQLNRALALLGGG